MPIARISAPVTVNAGPGPNHRKSPEKKDKKPVIINKSDVSIYPAYITGFLLLFYKEKIGVIKKE